MKPVEIATQALFKMQFLGDGQQSGFVTLFETIDKSMRRLSQMS